MDGPTAEKRILELVREKNGIDDIHLAKELEMDVFEINFICHKMIGKGLIGMRSPDGSINDLEYTERPKDLA